MTRATAPAIAPTAPIGEWWTSFFDETYATIGLMPRHGPEAEQAADGIVKLLELERGALVFDQCCGIGRIALPLARRGMRVCGVELMQAYVDTASRAAAAEGLDASFTCGDAYRFVQKPPCDVAVNIFTSFGYSDDDERNLEMLRAAQQSVRPGGRLMLERMNPCWIVAYGLGTSAYRVPDGNGGETLIIDEPRADWVRGLIRSTWTIVHPDGHREVRSFETRMYFPNELASLVNRAGFDDVALFGGLDGCPYDRYSRRLVLTARRP